MAKKRHKKHEEEASEAWLLPYSDLMTLLLALFIALFAISQTDQTKLNQLAQAFTSVRLAGDRYVRDVELREANGDVTRLHFEAMTETPATLTRDEAARFD